MRGIRVYSFLLLAVGLWLSFLSGVYAQTSDTQPPSTPTGLTASAVDADQINLSWTASTDNVGVTGYQVLRCQGTYCTPYTVVATVSATTYSDMGLSPSTTYRYRVRARDAAGNFSNYSSTVTRSTLADTLAPTAPTNLTTSAVDADQINLSWTASTDNVSVTQYRIERCQGSTCTSFSQIATSTGTSYNNTGLSTGTSYRYRVRAADATGNLSGYSNIANAATPTDTQSPTAPTNLTATPVSGSQINLSWTASTDNVSVTGYMVERCQGAGCSNFTQIATPTGTSYSNTGLPSQATYSYRVRARDAAGNLSDYSNTITTMTLDVTAPTAPTNLQASVASVTQINLTWTASTDTVGVTGYQVERCQGSTCTYFTRIATVTETIYSNTGLSPYTTYRYRVRALDAAGNTSSYSNIASATTPQDTTPPSAPTNLNGAAVSGSQINLSWAASTDDVSVTGYRIERCTGSTCTSFSQIATSTGTTYSNTGLTSATWYRYRVRATDARGNLSGYSDIVTVMSRDVTRPSTPANLSATPVSVTQINLSWTASTDNIGVTGYQVERCQGSGCSSFSLVATVEGTTYSNIGLLAGTSYRYRVRATDAAGNLSYYSNIVNAITTGTLGAMVLVNSASASYEDFEHYIKPYLDNFGIPYGVVDIATASVTTDILNSAVIIVGHKELDVDASYLSSTEQNYITSAVNAGVGLVNFDNKLDDYGTPRYNYVQTIFNFGYGGETEGKTVTFPNPAAHYITQQHGSDENIGIWRMSLAGITLPSGVTPLANSIGFAYGSTEPFLASTIYGNGRAVQWGSYDWMSHDVWGPLTGLDDLVWRSIVWAARKPFVMQGMPPFVTMRMDDTIGPLWWIHIANEFGFVPWAGVFTDDIDDAEATDLANLVNSGKATVGMHSFGTNNFFYFDHNTGTNFSDATMTSNFAETTAWFNTRNIPISKYAVPHYYEIGSNAFGGLQNWGVEFIGTMMDPGQLESEAPWMMKGPYRLYETGAAREMNANPYYADFMTIPGRPEHDGKFFNCVTEIRDVTGYEWLGNGRTGVSVAIQDGTEWFKRSFDSMVLPTLYSHQYAMGSMSQASWRAIMQGITNNISQYDPIYVSMDYACQYVRAIKTSNIVAYEFNPATQQVSTTLSGDTDMLTKFYLFTEAGGNIRQALIDVPQFNGSAQVTAAPPPPDTVPPTVTSVTPSDGASDVSTFVDVSAAFSEKMDPTTINTANFTLRDSLGNLVPASVNYNAATRTVTLTVDGLLTNSATYTASVKGGASGVKDDSGNPMTVDFSWSFTTETETVLTMWDDTALVENEISDGQSIEVGVKFRLDIDGYISGLRFYKGPLNTGTHVGHLWSRNGILLASGTFANETATGWQEVSFATPVPILANTTYVASYYSPTGYFSVEEGFFETAGADKGVLHFLSEGVDGSNGVYMYGSGFPTSSYRSSNYWVDVVYEIAGPPDQTPPTVYSVSPANNASGRKVNTNVSVTFNDAMDASSIGSGTFELRDSSTNMLVSAVVMYDPSTWTATLNPVADLTNSTTYTARAKGGIQGVKDAAGNPMASDYVWSFTTATLLPPPNHGPGGPILVVTSTANPFSEYYAEILRTEGFNAFSVSNISQVTAQYLAGYDVVILGEMPLTVSEVSIISDWVNNGGNLIAMRPDKKLANLLGLSDISSGLSDAYLLINTSSGPGKGIVNETIQYHGAADLYGLSGALSVATLYSSATTSTANPAVTMRGVGSNGGHAAAFTYDLAKSVAYTRQGNPAWAGKERDGVPPIRPNDLFFGAASGDPQPDWIDLNKVAIPQADEQQRLLANLIIQVNLDRKPLPRFWYFPRSLEAVVVMTGDDHGNAGTAGRFDSYLAKSPPGCSVENWECIRGTSYIEQGAISDIQAASYNAAGFEIGLHVDTGCADWTPFTLETFYADQLANFYTLYPSLPYPVTERTHCIVWSDYDTQPQVEFNNGIRFDTNYYYWPGSWISNRPGFFTGSGMPMRFTKADGTMIDVYQATTQMTDESGQTYPFTINGLLDKAVGPEGYYGAFTANMHNDNAASGGSDAIVAAAQARQIPVVSARQMLEWLDGRNGSSFSNLNWNGNELTFTVSVGQNTTGLMAMVPVPDGLIVTGILNNGNQVTYSVGTIKGIQYVFFYALAGTYQVSFSNDNTPPVISGVEPGSGISGVNTNTSVSVTFSEAIDPASITGSSFELLDTANAVVSAQVTYNAAAKTATLDPTNLLLPLTTYTAIVKGGTSGVKDLAGNQMSNDVTWSFTTSEFQGYSIWSGGGTPLYDAVSDGAPIEVGVKFRADINGYITGVRFYKGAANTGTHLGNLWDRNGALLASATFTSETASGWQQVVFPTPVPIAANTTYVASYYSSSGYFAMDVGYFASAGVDNGVLHALANGVDGGNGVYKYAASGFPNQSGNGNNYWVDVVFKP